jgi:hypothetical protein
MSMDAEELEGRCLTGHILPQEKKKQWFERETT